MTEQAQQHGSHETFQIIVAERFEIDTLAELLSRTDLDEVKNLSERTLLVSAAMLQGTALQVVTETIKKWLDLMPPLRIGPAVTAAKVIQHVNGVANEVRVFAAPMDIGKVQ